MRDQNVLSGALKEWFGGVGTAGRVVVHREGSGEGDRIFGRHANNAENRSGRITEEKEESVHRMQ